MLQHIPVGQMTWGPRAPSPWQAVPGAEVASPGMLEKGRSFSCSRAGRSTGVLPSLWAWVDFIQRLEVLQHKDGQAMGLSPAGCLFGIRSSAGAGVCPRLLAACAHTINNSRGSFK